MWCLVARVYMFTKESEAFGKHRLQKSSNQYPVFAVCDSETHNLVESIWTVSSTILWSELYQYIFKIIVIGKWHYWPGRLNVQYIWIMKSRQFRWVTYGSQPLLRRMAPTRSILTPTTLLGIFIATISISTNIFNSSFIISPLNDFSLLRRGNLDVETGK